MARGADGGDGWTWNDEPPTRTFGIEATAGRTTQSSGYKWEDILPGNYDGAAHIADMMQAGVDATMLFPSVPVMAWNMGASEFAMALIQTSNDWVFDEFCAPDHKRLIALPMLPVNHGIEATLAEADRFLKKGVKGLHIPVWPDVPYIDRQYDPLWALAAEAGTPLVLHRTTGGLDPASKQLFRYKEPGVNVAGTVIRFFAGVEPLTMLIFSGVFARHPNLKVMDAELNFGWLPFWKSTMDDQFQRQRPWAQFPFDTPPGETLGKNVFVSVLDDKVGFDLVQYDPQIADAALFCVDYPHSVCLWPNTAEYIEKATVNCDPISKQKILAGNAVRIFNLN